MRVQASELELQRAIDECLPRRTSLASRANPGGARPYTPPVDIGGDRTREVAKFRRAMRLALPLLRASDFDLRVVQKWQHFPSQCSDAEKDELRSLGRWLRTAGYRPPIVPLHRGVGVRGWNDRWPRVPDDEVTKYCLGLRSWSRHSAWSDIFCGTDECALFTMTRPPEAIVVMESRSLERWMRSEHPDLFDLFDSETGHAGLDGGEYLLDATALSVLRKRRGHGATELHGSDSTHHFSVSLAAH